ncbi:MAG: redoxin domain-containing protein [Firmicutes bacterium]|nr:redoxin domain-containing protein [Bacillota bacterium]
MAEPLNIGDPFPSFVAQTYDGRPVDVEALYRQGPLYLVFLRGFACPYCRRNLADLQAHARDFEAEGATVLIIGPDDASTFQKYFQAHELTFLAIADPQHTLLDRYGQQVKWYRLGRMPAEALVNTMGVVRFVHYGHSMADIPPVEEVLEQIRTLKEVGETFPEIHAMDANGIERHLSDYKGKQAVVLYFYPKDMTPGCTREAHDFNDHLSEFQALQASVLGISVDTQESHQAFANSCNLQFPLLSDANGQIADSLGLLTEIPGHPELGRVAKRTTFVIDREGVLRARFDVDKVDGHVEEVLGAVRALRS